MKDSVITRVDEIPEASFYVSYKDTFFSGWRSVDNKDNVVIIPCKNHDEALLVMNNVTNRPDAVNINMASSVDHFKRRFLNNPCIFSLLTKESAPLFFKPGYFKTAKVIRRAKESLTTLLDLNEYGIVKDYQDREVQLIKEIEERLDTLLRMAGGFE